MSLSTLSWRRFLYVSALAPTMPSTVVGQILRQSRERNHRLKLSGALLFDGERFCQLIEGECRTTQALMARIANDRRHHDVNLLLDAVVSSPRLMTNWQCGYCDHEAFEAITAAAAIDPQHAVQAFMRVLSGSDLST